MVAEFIVIIIGRWSDESWVTVSHCVKAAYLAGMAVMSGAVSCVLLLPLLKGFLVGTSSLMMSASEKDRISSMVVPLWSVWLSLYQFSECPFISETTMASSLSASVKYFLVMLSSSFTGRCCGVRYRLDRVIDTLG